jgi:hypothetical protein
MAAFINQEKYKEGPDSTFTSNGKEYNVDYFIDYAQEIPAKEIPVKDLVWIFKFAKPGEKKRVKNADLSVPILITNYGKKLLVVDGYHRLTKAYEEHKETILARLIPKEAFKEYDKKFNTNKTK